MGRSDIDFSVITLFDSLLQRKSPGSGQRTRGLSSRLREVLTGQRPVARTLDIGLRQSESSRSQWEVPTGPSFETGSHKGLRH